MAGDSRSPSPEPNPKPTKPKRGPKARPLDKTNAKNKPKDAPTPPSTTSGSTASSGASRSQTSRPSNNKALTLSIPAAKRAGIAPAATSATKTATRPNTATSASNGTTSASNGARGSSGGPPQEPTNGDLTQLERLLNENPELLHMLLAKTKGNGSATAADDEEPAPDGDAHGGHGQAGRQRVQGAKRMREQVDDEEEPVAHRDSSKQKKKFSTIPDPKKQKDKVSQGLQQDMRLGNDDAFYASCRNTTQDYVRRANVSPTLTWNKWSPSKKALVIQGVEGKIPYLRRMEDHWAVIALAQQYLKNHRQGLRKKGELEADERYAHCGANALMRGSGNRTKKVKLARQEQERRRLEDEDAAIGAPVRKRARVERARPEFEQGSSRDGERGVADEDENDEDYDSSSAHPQRDRRYRPEEDDEQGSD